MNKKLLLAAGLALMSAAASAQEVKFYNTGRKWNSSFDALLKGNSIHRVTRKGAENISADSNLQLMVTTIVGGAEAVANYAIAEGYQAEAPTDQLAVITAPARFIKTLADRSEVLYINKSEQLFPTMHLARTETGVTKVTEGTGLDTPYDGTGVVVGVIDQGFEFKHPAFAKACKKWGSSATTGMLKNSAPFNDPNDNEGHATHVANIAVGRKVEGCDYYGVATGAELLPMMSNLSTSSTVAQAAAIKKYAEGEGKPWVINMSFGSNSGPHDGSSDTDQNMDKLSTKGGILVGAMGNSGAEKLHVMHQFTADGEKVYFYIKLDDQLNTNSVVYSEVWAANEGENLLTIRPVVLSRGKLHYPTAVQMNAAGQDFEAEVSPFNNRQYGKFSGYFKQLLTKMGLSTGEFVWEVEGKAGAECHAWLNTDLAAGAFAKTKLTLDDKVYTTPEGDGNYATGAGAASIPSSISVASYNNASGFTSINGNNYSYANYVGDAADISKFSSRGPSLSTDPKALPTPTIAAPGGVVISAFSKKAKSFSTDAAENVQKVVSGGNPFYYGVMSGTSMATPVVTGIIALWLQANPELTSADVAAIMQKTARKDSYTGRNLTWNKDWGYGKIDAYEGLKEAIRMRTNGINQTLNTTTPVTLQKNDDAWKVLFNNDESYADVRVIATSGQVVYAQHVVAPQHGDELVVSTQSLAPGVYVFQVSTTASTVTRKLIINN